MTVDIGAAPVVEVSEPRCKTCVHPRRAEIEALLLEGHAPRPVLLRLEIARDLRTENIREHLENGHFPEFGRAMAAAAERAAQEALPVFDSPMTMKMATHVVFAQQVVDQVMRRLEAGEVQPKISDAIAAAKLLEAIPDQHVQRVSNEQHWMLGTLVEVLKRQLTREQLEAIMGEVGRERDKRDVARTRAGTNHR